MDMLADNGTAVEPPTPSFRPGARYLRFAHAEPLFPTAFAPFTVQERLTRPWAAQRGSSRSST